MNYNTSREALLVPEYGRHIHKMAKHLLDIPDREKRTRTAHHVVNIMNSVNPIYRKNELMQKHWDFLARITDYKLDIDYPCEPPKPEELESTPNKVPYDQKQIRYKHYGSINQDLVQKALDFPEGDEKELLILMIAKQMKKSYILWHGATVPDEVILKDLEKMSGGKLKVNKELKLGEHTELLQNQQKQGNPQRSKRKKKRKRN
jgi:hypothetical protein